MFVLYDLRFILLVPACCYQLVASLQPSACCSFLASCCSAGFGFCAFSPRRCPCNGVSPATSRSSRQRDTLECGSTSTGPRTSASGGGSTGLRDARFAGFALAKASALRCACRTALLRTFVPLSKVSRCGGRPHGAMLKRLRARVSSLLGPELAQRISFKSFRAGHATEMAQKGLGIEAVCQGLEVERRAQLCSA